MPVMNNDITNDDAQAALNYYTGNNQAQQDAAVNANSGISMAPSIQPPMPTAAITGTQSGGPIIPPGTSPETADTMRQLSQPVGQGVPLPPSPAPQQELATKSDRDAAQSLMPTAPSEKPNIANTSIIPVSKPSGGISPYADLLKANKQSGEDTVASLQRQAKDLKDAAELAAQGDQWGKDFQNVVAKSKIEYANNSLAQTKYAFDVAHSKSMAIQKKMNEVPDVDAKKAYVGGTFGQVLAAIGMGLGGFGAGMTKSRNFAADILHNAIEANVDAQKANIEKQWKQISADKDFAHDELVQRLFIQQKEDDVRLAHYSNVIQIADNMKSKYFDDPAKQANLDAALEPVQQKIAQYQLDTAQRAAEYLARQQSAAQAGANRAREDEKERREAIVKYEGMGYDHIAAVAMANYDRGLETGGVDVSKLRNPKGLAAGEQQTKDVLSDISTAYDKASKNPDGTSKDITGTGGLKTRIYSSLPVAAGSNIGNALTGGILPTRQNIETAKNTQNEVDTVNDAILTGAVRTVGDRMPPEAIKAAIQPFTIKLGDDQTVIDKKKQLAMATLGIIISTKKTTKEKPATTE